MSLPVVTPQKARELIEQGALLVDIREASEFARERIGAAHHAPLSQLDRLNPASPPPYVVFHCRSGHRTMTNAGRLACATDVDAYILEGGLDAWKRAGLPVVTRTRQPIAIMRQVQIAAGALIVAGVVLGALAHPGFYALAGVVGAGLLFAGVTGVCVAARLLARAPWNRSAAPA